MPTLHPGSCYARWAKTARDGSGRFHLLPFHSLDVAAVLAAGFARNPALLARIAAALQMEHDTARRLMLALAILHDVGKCAGTFQAMADDVARVLGTPINGVMRYNRRTRGHDRMGQAFLLHLAEQGHLPMEGTDVVRREVLAVATGHHGKPPGMDDYLLRFPNAYSPADIEAAAELTRIAKRISGWDGTLPGRAAWRRTSFMLAGLLTLCDWLGSSDRFAMIGTPELAEDYFQRMVQGPAATLVADVAPAPFRPAVAPPRRRFTDLFAHLDRAAAPVPTPMQCEVERLTDTLPPGPLLLVIEDLTGSGKTEAADLFVHAMLALGRASGAYYGLPTMATAEAAYARKLEALPGILGAGADLVLAHGKAFGATGWRLRARWEPGEATPHEWFTARSRRALLAQGGVGTVDQALAGALRSRTATPRLLGLWNKVLVVDEVHACDPYIAGLLSRVLYHHATTGASAVLLSATLPCDLHRRLAKAFAEGAGWTARGFTAAKGYPALTLHHCGGVACRDDVPPNRVPPTATLRRLDDINQVHQAIIAWLQAGRSVLWFRNSVADAVEAERALAPALDAQGLAPSILYHARFLLSDRTAIEQRVEAAFGKRAAPDQRRGRLLIATQVAEQSLDLDADEVVSDLAPADNLVQRLGRRRRHRRDASGALLSHGPDQRPPEATVVFAPDPAAVRDGDWCAHLLPRTAYVYPDTARLWLTAAALFLPCGISGVQLLGRFRPIEDARRLMDVVYPEESFSDNDPVRDSLPVVLREAFDTAVGTEIEDRNVAMRRCLRFDGGWLKSWNGHEVDDGDDGTPPTRLGDMHEAVLLTRDECGVRLLGEHLDSATCRVPQRVVSDPDVQEARDALARSGKLSSLDAERLRWKEAIILQQDEAEVWRGATTCVQRRGGHKQVHVAYCSRYGLRLGVHAG